MENKTALQSEFTAVAPKVEGREIRLKSPELFFKMLSDIEFLIVKVLYHATNALDAREIHYLVAHEIVLQEEDRQKIKFDEQLSKAEWLKRVSKFVRIPSYYLIVKTLQHLFLNGIVWSRKMKEKKENCLYFLNPKVYSFLKEVEQKVPLELQKSFYKKSVELPAYLGSLAKIYYKR